MPPFSPKSVISGFKEKIDSLAVQGDRLYIGTAVGSLHVYSVDNTPDEELVSLVEVKKNLTRRSIEQLGFIKDINSLVVLSEASVTLFPLPTFSPPTVLAAAKAAFSFGTHTFVKQVLPVSDGFETAKNPIPTLHTFLIVGCRRKVVVYSWKDGEAQGSKEVALPHSPRAISFVNEDTACFAYSATEFAVFSISQLTATDVAFPLPTSTSAGGIGAFTGLTGYMTLGLGAKSKPSVLQISESDTLLLKDNEGLFIGADGKPSRTETIQWPAPPEEIAFLKPYIVSVLPPRSVQASEPDPDHPVTTVVQIRSSTSLLPTQTLHFPFDNPTASSSNATVRLLTPSPSTKSPLLFMVTTPTDRTAATAEGSSVWQFSMKSWPGQLDELVQVGQYSEALALLESIDQKALPDKVQRRTRIKALNAVSQFRDGKFEEAIDTMKELDVNPAKVIALYPEPVAGRLSVPRDQWIPLFGGPAVVTPSAPAVDPSPPTPPSPSGSGSSGTKEKEKEVSERHYAATDFLESLGGTSTIRGRLKGLGAFMGAAAKEGEAPSGSVVHPSPSVNTRKPSTDSVRSIDTLIQRYLADRRPKISAALAAMDITPANQSHEFSVLSATPVEELFALPDAPLSALTAEQLLRFAQIVDTALFKCYLVKESFFLLGSLCRLPNWCEVSEVEEELRARQKFAELKDLYGGKKMHSKALELLRHLGEKEEDKRDKLQPSISYLQKLGTEYLDQIFEASRWIFAQDRDMAFEIFTSDDVDLPRPAVANYLEGIDPGLCIRYLEFLLEERKEESPVYHDRLAELYLKITLGAKKRGDQQIQKEVYAKLLTFIDTTDHYRVDRLYGLISSEELFEARAILLGRLGRHDQALELYVYRLQDFIKAEEYCKRYYHPGTPTDVIYLQLLRIYLRPTVKTATDLLPPALELISRHSPRLDPVETIQLLPPLVTTQDVRTFLCEALRAPVFDTHVIRQIRKSRNDQLARRLMLLQSKKVKVTDSRICPHCHKRIGNSVIAVHAPRGEVTHYQCREGFSKRLKETRH